MTHQEFVKLQIDQLEEDKRWFALKVGQVVIEDGTLDEILIFEINIPERFIFGRKDYDHPPLRYYNFSTIHEMEDKGVLIHPEIFSPFKIKING